MRRLLPIDNPKYIVFSDFDATYLSHVMTEYDRTCLKKLESFLENKAHSLGLLFGFVSGSSREGIIAKMRDYNLSVFPHFIAGSLATEVTYECRNNKGKYDHEWEEIMKKEYCQERIKILIKKLQENSIYLIPQSSKNNTCYKKSYYYSSINSQNIDQIRSLIQKRAREFKVAVNFSACNPTIGDPAGSYDVEFIPLKAGKHQLVKTFLQKYNLKKENGYAFGDSENDIKMLKTVKNGYLVANAVACPRKWKIPITTKQYAEGILEILERLP